MSINQNLLKKNKPVTRLAFNQGIDSINGVCSFVYNTSFKNFAIMTNTYNKAYKLNIAKLEHNSRDRYELQQMIDGVIQSGAVSPQDITEAISAASEAYNEQQLTNEGIQNATSADLDFGKPSEADIAAEQARQEAKEQAAAQNQADLNQAKDILETAKADAAANQDAIDRTQNSIDALNEGLNANNEAWTEAVVNGSAELVDANGDVHKITIDTYSGTGTIDGEAKTKEEIEAAYKEYQAGLEDAVAEREAQKTEAENAKANAEQAAAEAQADIDRLEKEGRESSLGDTSYGSEDWGEFGGDWGEWGG